MADFELVARRRLDKAHHQLFRFHFILGASPSLCASRLRISNSVAKKAIKRIETILGRTFSTLEPYPLYPLIDYFNKHKTEPVQPCRLPPRHEPQVWPSLSSRAGGRQRLIA